MFIDEAEIEVEAGKGGDGCVSFRREKYIPRGGPDGGDGGDGGSVILLAEEGVDSLAPLTHRRQWKAEDGQRGGGANCHGRSSGDLVIPVPPGTVVIDAEHGHVLKDLSAAGERVVAAQGGKGGKGNVRFKSATNRAPRESTPGDLGEARRLRLELKVIADVGLVGKAERRQEHAVEPALPRPARNRSLSVHHQASATSASCRSTSTARSSWPTFPV